MKNKTVGMINILLIEDSPSDADLTTEALGEAKIAKPPGLVEDGVQAIQFLRQTAPYENAPRPDLILLDLNLPKKDGREVLAEIKSDPQLRTIPVVVLTSSEAEQDVLQAYKLQGELLHHETGSTSNSSSRSSAPLRSFWLAIVRLPRPDGISMTSPSLVRILLVRGQRVRCALASRKPRLARRRSIRSDTRRATWRRHGAASRPAFLTWSCSTSHLPDSSGFADLFENPGYQAKPSGRGSHRDQRPRTWPSQRCETAFRTT